MTGRPRRLHLEALPAALLGMLLAWPGAMASAQGAPADGTSLAASRSDPVHAPFGSLEQPRLPAGQPAQAELSPRPAPEAGAGRPEATAPPKPQARPGTAAASMGLASTDSPEGYSVGPGDVIEVTVWQEPDASGQFKVGPDGTIHHYLVGDVGVAGHSIQEIGEVLRNALALGYLRDPRVSVQVVDYQSQKVFVHGEIARPGVYALRGPTDLLKLLLDAGGPTRDAGGECTLLQVERQGGKERVQSVTVAVNDLLVKGDLTQNRQVTNGDVIYMHPRDEGPAGSLVKDDRSYFVLGEVKNPGAYKYKEGISAMTAILEAGGFSEFARSNKTKLVREKDGQTDERIVKMGDVMEKGDRSLDVELLPGDVLVVPKSFF